MSKRYTEGIAGDGAAILDNGKQITVTEILDRLNQAESLVQKSNDIHEVNGISTNFEKDLFVLINKYAKAGLSKPHTVARLEWVLGSVKKS